jgi:hypothetical protein
VSFKNFDDEFLDKDKVNACRDCELVCDFLLAEDIPPNGKGELTVNYAKTGSESNFFSRRFPVQWNKKSDIVVVPSHIFLTTTDVLERKVQVAITRTGGGSLEIVDTKMSQSNVRVVDVTRKSATEVILTLSIAKDLQDDCQQSDSYVEVLTNSMIAPNVLIPIINNICTNDTINNSE